MDADIFLYKLKSVLTYLDLAQRIENVEGYLLDIQAYTLMLLANEGPGLGAIVEIGSFMGKSTCCLALGSMSAHREMVYAVDHFTGSPEHQKGALCENKILLESGSTYHKFQENIRQVGVAGHIHAIRASSEEAAKRWDLPIRLLFIDGDHSYEASKLDFELWSPHVAVGGVIVFHDIGSFDGVTRFYRELLDTSTAYREVVEVTGMAVVEKFVAG